MTDEMKASDATRYLVVQLDPKEPSNIAAEAYFASEGEARSYAEKEATKTDGASAYAVYQKIGSAQVERRVEWKGVAR